VQRTYPYRDFVATVEVELLPAIIVADPVVASGGPDQTPAELQTGQRRPVDRSVLDERLQKVVLYARACGHVLRSMRQVLRLYRRYLKPPAGREEVCYSDSTTSARACAISTGCWSSYVSNNCEHN